MNRIYIILNHNKKLVKLEEIHNFNNLLDKSLRFKY
jgi:hypothetical protein